MRNSLTCGDGKYSPQLLFSDNVNRWRSAQIDCVLSGKASRDTVDGAHPRSQKARSFGRSTSSDKAGTSTLDQLVRCLHRKSCRQDSFGRRAILDGLSD